LTLFPNTSNPEYLLASGKGIENGHSAGAGSTLCLFTLPGVTPVSTITLPGLNIINIVDLPSLSSIAHDGIVSFWAISSRGVYSLAVNGQIGKIQWAGKVETKGDHTEGSSPVGICRKDEKVYIGWSDGRVELYSRGHKYNSGDEFSLGGGAQGVDMTAMY
jgi:hypothetical protein